MNNFLTNLETRERRLIFIAIGLILSMSVIFGINSFLNKYSTSVKNLNKAKSDYEYVHLKALVLERPAISGYITNESLKTLLKKKNLLSTISNISISNDESSVTIKFNTTNLKDAVSFSEDIANNNSMKLSKIIYTSSQDKIEFELILN
ncbi:MAG: hypothetical protein ACI8WO_000591 [Methylophilaceae bacterium]|jgi:hypothetical protein|tara:strand:- start:166 stop:612 length:447 start_codon:yes stop_codon:yes gene_type:complete